MRRTILAAALSALCAGGALAQTWSEPRESEMPLGVPSVSANAYSGGTPSNARSLWVMADNALRHEHTLFPALSNGPNPSSQDPRRPMSNILTPQPQEPGAFDGLFVLSDATDRGYTFASPATGGCYSLTISSVTIDLRDATPSTFVSGGTAMARHVQAKIRASVAPNEIPNKASFSVAYSLTTRKFIISSTAGAFTMWTKTLDATSALPLLGFTARASTYTLAATYTADEARFHSDDWLVMRLDPSIFGPPGTSAEFVRWRWLWMVENTFAGGALATIRQGRYNLRFETAANGVVNLDISGVSTNTDVATYINAIGVLLAAANTEGWTMTWSAALGKALITQPGPPYPLLFTIHVLTDPNTAWVDLRFAFEYNIFIGSTSFTSTGAPVIAAGVSRGIMRLYIATTVAGLTEQPDSAFTEGTNMFTISQPDLAARPTYVGRSSGAQWRRGGLDSQRSRYWVADIADAIGTYLDAPTQIYARLKIVDPNRTTPLSIGALGFSAGWYPSINTESTSLGHEDRSTLQESVGGSLLPTPEMPRKATQYTFGAGNPLSARDAAFLDSLLGGELGGEEAARWIRGNRSPVFLIDPTYVPDEAATGPAKLAAGAAYGFMTWRSLDMVGRLAAGRRTGNLEFVEAK